MLSNRTEILEEYRQANAQLATLKQEESASVQSSSATVTIEPRFGNEMNALSSKCAQLDMILEAMEASED